MFVSKETISASAINYLYITYILYDTHTVSESIAERYYLYASVATSATSNVTSDSGSGSYGYMNATGGTSSSYTMYCVITMTGCTRTGYLKFAAICTQNGRSDDGMTLYFNKVQVYSSDPASTRPHITVT